MRIFIHTFIYMRRWLRFSARMFLDWFLTPYHPASSQKHISSVRFWVWQTLFTFTSSSFLAKILNPDLTLVFLIKFVLIKQHIVYVFTSHQINKCSFRTNMRLILHIHQNFAHSTFPTVFWVETKECGLSDQFSKSVHSA